MTRIIIRLSLIIFYSKLYVTFQKRRPPLTLKIIKQYIQPQLDERVKLNLNVAVRFFQSSRNADTITMEPNNTPRLLLVAYLSRRSINMVARRPIRQSKYCALA